MTSISSYACGKGSDGKTLCPGDLVVSPANDKGRVVEFNPQTQKVRIKVGRSISTSVYGLKSLYIGSGCSHNICVGDRIVSPDNHTGIVIGVNPHLGKISVDIDNYEAHDGYKINEVFVEGCLSGICSQDLIVTNRNDKGEVLGINPYTGLVALDLDNYDFHSVWTLESISVTVKHSDVQNKTSFTVTSPEEVLKFDYSLERKIPENK